MSAKYKIQVIVQYHPLHKYKYFLKRGNNYYLNLSNTEFFYKNMISFPMHVWMNNKDLNYLIRSSISTLKALLKKN